jgi:hypothetical protein
VETATAAAGSLARAKITPGTPKAFELFMSDKQYTPTIFLNSAGGDLVAGLKLGVMIRTKGLSTAVGKSVPESIDPKWEKIVPGQCVSACAYAFLGGVSRTAQPGEIGVHQFHNEAALNDPLGKLFTAVDLSVDQFVSALVIDHVAKMGADPRIVSIASATLPGEMHYFDEQELDELKVTWNPDLFQPWAIEPYGQGVVAYSKTQDRTKTATFFCRRDKAPRLLITDPIFDEAQNLKSAIDYLADGFEALGLKLPKEAANVRIVNGAPALEIKLIGLDLDKIQFAKDLTVSAELPRVSAGYFSHALNVKNAVPSFRVASRNCL